MSPGILALVPIRSLDSGKTRLASSLDKDQRRTLTLALATSVLDVLAATRSVDVAVVTSDDDVARWSRDQRTVALAPPSEGLNEAAAFGLNEAADSGYRHAAIVHADLAYPAELATLFDTVAQSDHGSSLWLAPDRDDKGTNVLVVPTQVAEVFRFGYGPDSATHHHREAESHGLQVRRWTTGRLGIDVDVHGDLDVIDLTRLNAGERPVIEHSDDAHLVR